MPVTAKQVKELVEVEREQKAKYGNYDCPICRKFIWWDEPHTHKEGQKLPHE